jgi:hypothetical protein
MRFAHPEFFQSQSSTGASIASKRAAEATTGPAGSELGFLGRFAVRPVFGFRKTGFWLEELAAPYYVFEDAGAPLSPKSPINGTR